MKAVVSERWLARRISPALCRVLCAWARGITQRVAMLHAFGVGQGAPLYAWPAGAVSGPTAARGAEKAEGQEWRRAGRGHQARCDDRPCEPGFDACSVAEEDELGVDWDDQGFDRAVCGE